MIDNIDSTYLTDKEMADLETKFKNLNYLRQQADERLTKLRRTNIASLYDYQIELIEEEEKRRIAADQEWAKKAMASGVNLQKALAATEAAGKVLAAKAELTKKQKALKEQTGLNKKELKERLKALEEEYEAKLKLEEELDEETRKLAEKRLEDEAKERAEQLQESLKSATETFGKTNIFTGWGKQTQKLKEQGMSDKDISTAKWSAAINAVGDFAKQLEGTVKDIAYSRTAIDTRLFGSNNEKLLGSYWKQMSWDIGANVAASPFVKQADVVTNLKTLVGKGIAFNVEQRAFLDTISEKIATTFEATDNTLLKLVRIQQADTTAARLGMEAALNEFLNSMYETTEYMTEAAASIRANIYEASALMGATEATAFEYQVQKWMGSLHSVGFNNTSGLSGALGKLAAGDISAVTDGGYGNLLVMAANRANLSIAEILADGLDDSKTNQLMQAMVEYLGQIYAETKNSKVVAQQFASVYGLTASDLKAAANLYGSTTNISSSVLNYGGMLGNLNRMADSMWNRTSMGEMMENLWGNFQYGLAEGMANNPVLYAVYNAATLLDSVAGGIALPDIKVMGSGVNLQTTVADLMRVASIGTSALGGIGKLVAGLAAGSGGGFSGSGMLKAFGVDNNITTLSRGKGTGLEALTSGSDTSTSGFVGNSDGSDVQNKTLDDANEDGNKQLAEKQDEDSETKLSTVDEHIVEIWRLLQDVTSGISSFRVVLETGLPNNGMA